MQIGEMAERVGVNIQTIRFYERRELLRKPDRLPSGYRDYPENALRRVRFIKSTQEVGFTLKEIKELIRLAGGATSQRWRSASDCGSEDSKYRREGGTSEVDARGAQRASPELPLRGRSGTVLSPGGAR